MTQLQWNGREPPNYTAVWAARYQRLLTIRANPQALIGAKEYYRTRPIEFIEDWLDTVDPRKAAEGKPTRMPFIMFPKQHELVQFFYAAINDKQNALIEKCRDMGATWVACAFSVWLWLFVPGAAVGWGSRKEQLVDRIGDMDSIFEKIRTLVRCLPPEFLPVGYSPKDHATFMKMVNPENESSITGEAGDNIGRGGRKLIYFKDEAQPLDARILTPHGWSTMGEMRVGSKVIGSTGVSRTVTAINDAGLHPVYRFTFSDGTSTRCSPNHLWTVVRRGVKKTVRACEIAEDYRYRSPGGQTQYLYRVPVTGPVEFERVPGLMPLHPYIIGALIGDGSVSGVPKYRPSFTSADPEIIEEIRSLLPDDCCIRPTGQRYAYNLGDADGRRGKGKLSRMSRRIVAAGIAGMRAENKHIPDAYLYARPADRLALLQGLMDTDGSASGGVASFHTCSQRLAEDVRFLVQAHGGTATLNVKQDRRGFRDMYVLHIALAVPLFRLPRKLSALKPRKHPPDRIIVNVELMAPEAVRCITIDHDDGLYLTDHCIVTHNSAHYERPELIEAALADNTNTQVDISSVNGLGNVFHRRRKAGVVWPQVQPNKTRVFIMDWRDHPNKDQAWYDARRQKAIDDGLLHKFAQEVERDYSSAVEGIIIKSIWVNAAIDAHKLLGFDDSGGWIASLDVADGGGDSNGFALRKGVVLKAVDQWGEEDTGVTSLRALKNCREWTGGEKVHFQYDSVGVGAGVKSEANAIQRLGSMPKNIEAIVPWGAGDKVLWPDKPMVRGDKNSPLNKDFFKNLKAQAWWHLARRFERTWRAVEAYRKGEKYDWKPEDLISIPSDLTFLRQLEAELCQPVWAKSRDFKMLVDKTPDGTKSPNIADAVMMTYFPVKSKGGLTLQALAKVLQ